MTGALHEPKWRRLPEERPHQILAAAIEVFGEYGLSAARIDDIARRAGVSKGTIYLYFPNKEALFKEMIRQTIVARIEETEENLGTHTGSATEQLRTFMEVWWGALLSTDYIIVYRLVLAELHRFPELAEFYANEVVRRKLNLISRVIGRGIASGEFRPIDPVMASRILGSMFASHALWRAMRHCAIPETLRFSDEETLTQIMDFFLTALRPDRAAPPASSVPAPRSRL